MYSKNTRMKTATENVNVTVSQGCLFCLNIRRSRHPGATFSTVVEGFVVGILGRDRNGGRPCLFVDVSPLSRPVLALLLFFARAR